ncbi:hypothetical protein ACETU7_05445 [Rhodococcus sp. 3Y1]
MRFVDGSSADYDLVLCATGYHLDYPFIAREDLDWSGAAPDLFLNVASRRHDNLFVLGMVEASGLGWQGPFRAGRVGGQIDHRTYRSPRRGAGILGGGGRSSSRSVRGYKYLKLGRMAYYVNKDAYRSAIKRHIGLLDAALTKGGQ